jgi:aminoglycoside phosphotransferase
VAIDTGMSEARVWRLDIDLVKPRYIKIAQGQARGQLRREIKRTRWLAVRHVRVPTILRIHEDTGFMALLSGAVPGVVATRADFSPAGLAAASWIAVIAVRPTAISISPSRRKRSRRLSVAMKRKSS